MNAVYKTMMAYGALATSLLAQTNIDRLFTDEGYWAKSAKAATEDFSTFEWESSIDKAVLKNTDIHLWNRNVDGFNMVSRDGYLRSLNVLIDTTKSKSEFTEQLEKWVAVFDVNLGVDHSQSAYKGKDGSKSMSYRWKKDTYYIYLTGSSSKDDYTISLRCKPKVVADTPAHIAAEKDRLDGLYERDFYTPDYSKSFRGRIVGFDEAQETIKVQTQRSTLTVPLDELSERDNAYYEEIKDFVIASKNLSVSIVEKKANTQKNGRAISSDVNFAIKLYNSSTQKIEDLEIQYDIYYKVDTMDALPVLKKKSDSINISSIYAKYGETAYTEAIPIIRETRPGTGGG